ncbi:MAG TPA: DMT family transporter [Candidatus Competibacteraceae bacterium]|nr:DMT family transporter [Candidatus Competibacteraceae bacterium]
MRTHALKADLFLLLAATIWGTAFAAQRVGMDSIGPLLFTGLRFLLGALVIVPLALRAPLTSEERRLGPGRCLSGGLLAGILLFLGAAIQQVGLIYTTAANAGFITGLYVIMVPLFGLALGQRTGLGTWLGGLLAVTGLYFLSVGESWSIAYGDALQLLGAVFWAGHVLFLGHWSGRLHPVRLALYQFLTCATLSLLGALLSEDIAWHSIQAAAVPLLYGGLISVGVGFTLQVLGQRDAIPAHAAIILSLEAVVAALAGWLFLGETLSSRAVFGCALMLGGMLVAQLLPLWRARRLRPA